MAGGNRPRRRASHTAHLLKHGAAKLGRLVREDGGAIAVVAGIVFPVVIGGMGLGSEAGYWYYTQRKLQHAADVSVYAAAVRKSQNDSTANVEKAALHIAEEAGFNKAAGSIEVNTPPQAPSENAGKTDHIQVILTESVPRLFTSIFTGEPLTLSGHAVASIEYGSPGCVLALSKNASKAIQVSGNTTVQLTACDVAANSTASDAFYQQNNASSMTTGCVHSAGGVNANSNLILTDQQNRDGPCKDGPRENAPAAVDPYADILTPSPAGLTCDSNGNVGKNNGETIEPKGNYNGIPAMCFSKGLTVKDEVTFADGIYFISGGDLRINAKAKVSGKNVTFVLLDGAAIDINGSAKSDDPDNPSIDLAAPTDPNHPFAGILFFADKSGTVTANHKVNGNSSSVFNGAIYTPTGQIKFAGGASTTGGCLQIIANTVEFTGGSRVGSDCKDAGTRSMQFGQRIALVE